MPSINVNIAKLIELVEEGIAGTRGMCIDESTLIGVIDGRQIQLKVTRSERDFFDEDGAKHICVEKTKPSKKKT